MGVVVVLLGTVPVADISELPFAPADHPATVLVQNAYAIYATLRTLCYLCRTVCLS